MDFETYTKVLNDCRQLARKWSESGLQVEVLHSDSLWMKDRDLCTVWVVLEDCDPIYMGQYVMTVIQTARQYGCKCTIDVDVNWIEIEI